VQPENVGSAAFFGWDTSLKLALPFSLSPKPLEKPVLGFFWLYQLSWLITTAQGNFSLQDNVRIPYMPLHTFGASLELPWKTRTKELPGSIVVSARYESTRYAGYERTGNTKALDPHFLLNIVFNQKVNGHFNLFGRVNNVLNTRYVSFADYPMPGISLTIGMSMNFEGVGGNAK
jgi:vitamin B12 transporter